jgi:hypothetical protein
MSTKVGTPVIADGGTCALRLSRSPSACPDFMTVIAQMKAPGELHAVQD